MLEGTRREGRMKVELGRSVLSGQTERRYSRRELKPVWGNSRDELLVRLRSSRGQEGRVERGRPGRKENEAELESTGMTFSFGNKGRTCMCSTTATANLERDIRCQSLGELQAKGSTNCFSI